MKIDVLTVFPEIYSVLESGIIGKALEKKLFDVNVVNVRDYSEDKHKKTDDYPFGGGAGMVMLCQPLVSAIRAVDPDRTAKRIYLSPQGKRLDQTLVKELAKEDKLLLVNGSYEGIDQRVIDLEIDEELSIGDYVMTCGDLGSLVLINCVARYIEGVLGSEASTDEESFENNLLEYPQYTRPQNFEGLEVPEVLLSGNHKKIKEWRDRMSLEVTKKKRPDLLK